MVFSICICFIFFDSIFFSSQAMSFYIHIYLIFDLSKFKKFQIEFLLPKIIENFKFYAFFHYQPFLIIAKRHFRKRIAINLYDQKGKFFKRFFLFFLTYTNMYIVIKFCNIIMFICYNKVYFN